MRLKLKTQHTSSHPSRYHTRNKKPPETPEAEQETKSRVPLKNQEQGKATYFHTKKTLSEAGLSAHVQHLPELVLRQADASKCL